CPVICRFSGCKTKRPAPFGFGSRRSAMGPAGYRPRNGRFVYPASRPGTARSRAGDAYLGGVMDSEPVIVVVRVDVSRLRVAIRHCAEALLRPPPFAEL